MFQPFSMMTASARAEYEREQRQHDRIDAVAREVLSPYEYEQYSYYQRKVGAALSDARYYAVGSDSERLPYGGEGVVDDSEWTPRTYPDHPGLD